MFNRSSEMSLINVCHVTTVHSRYDTRILENQCVYLARHFNVTLIVADGLQKENYSGVNINSLYEKKGKLARLLNSV